jgi:hypothetical protein
MADPTQPAPPTPFQALTSAQMRDGLHAGASVVSDEDDGYHHAEAVGADYDTKIKAQFPGIADDARGEIVEGFKQDLRNNLSGQLLRQHVNAAMRYKESGVLGGFLGARGDTSSFMKVLPGGVIYDAMHSRDLTDAAKSIGTGQGTRRAYEIVADRLADQEYSQKHDPGFAQEVWDATKGIPKTVAEYMVTNRFLPGAASAEAPLGTQAIKTLARGAAWTALRPDELIAGTMEKAAPHLSQDVASGQLKLDPGDDLGLAAGKAVFNSLSSKVLWEAAGTFQPKGTGLGAWGKSTGKTILASQAEQALQHYVTGGGGGDVMTAYANAKTDAEKNTVLKRFGAEVVALGGMEGVLHGFKEGEPPGPTPAAPEQPPAAQTPSPVQPTTPGAQPTPTVNVPPHVPPPAELGAALDQPHNAGHDVSDLAANAPLTPVPPETAPPPAAPEPAPEQVAKYRLMLQGLGQPSKMTPEKVMAEASRLGLDKDWQDKPPVPVQPQKPATFAEPPEVPKPLGEKSNTAFEDVRRKIASGQRLLPADVDKVFEEAQLTPIEQHVLQQRLLQGRSHADISGDPEAAKPNGKPFTRQRIKQFEQSALAKMGMDRGSVESAVNEHERMDAAIDMAEKGKRLGMGELNAFDPQELGLKAKARTDELSKIDQKMESLSEELVNGVAPEREKEILDEFTKLDQRRKSWNQAAEGEPGELREPGGAAPVRPADGGSLPLQAPAPEVDAPPAGVTGGGADSGGPGGEDALTQRRKAGGNLVSPLPPATQARLNEAVRTGNRFERNEIKEMLAGHFTDAEIEQALAVAGKFPKGVATDHPALQGFPPETIADFAKQIKKTGKVDTLQQWELQKQFPGRSISQMIDQLRGQADKPPQFGQGELRGTNAQAEGGMRKYYREQQITQEIADHEAVKAAKSGLNPAAVEAIGQRAEEAGVREADAAVADEGRLGEGSGFHGDEPESGHGESFLWGASGSSPVEWASGLVPLALLKRQYDRFIGINAGRIRDFWVKANGISFPSTTKASRPLGEAMGRYDAVHSGPAVQMAASNWIDKILPHDLKPEENAKFAAAAIEQLRIRHGKQAFLDKSAEGSQEAAQARAAAATATTPQTKAGFLKAAEDGAQKATEYMQKHREVKSVLDDPDSPIKTEAEYQAVLADPRYKAMLDAYGKSGFVQEIEANYRGAMGMDETDPIDSLTQTPGLPINLMGSDKSVAGKQGAGNLGNLKIQKFQFAKEAGLNSTYKYDMAGMIHNTLQRGMEAAAKATMYRTAAEEGQGVWGKGFIEGTKDIPFTSPPKGTQDAEPGDTFHAKPEVYDEMRQVLRVDKPHDPIPFANELTALSLIAPAGEVTAHTSNLLTAMMRPGMWKGILKGDLIRNAVGVIGKNPEIATRLMELAKIDALKGRGPEQDSAMLGKLNPAHWSAKVLDTISDMMRLTLEDSYNRLSTENHWLTGEPLVAKGETAKRDFINGAVGQYSKGAQPRFMVLMRELGLAPFITAGTKYYMGGLDVMTGRPGVEAANLKSRVILQGQQLAKVAAVLGGVALTNYLLWKRWDGDDSTPFGALKIGQTADGKSRYIDTANLIGLRRGMRATGVNAMLEGYRRGESGAGMTDKAQEEIVSSLVHPFLGPPGQFAYTAVTGKNALGMKVADQPEPGGSQAWQNVVAALKNANPGVGALMGADRPGQDVPWGERFAKLAGPFSPKTRNDPAVGDFYDELTRAQASHQQFLQKRQSGLAVPGYGPQQLGQYRRLEAFHSRMAQLNKAMRAAQTDQQKANIRALQVKVAKAALGR